MWRAEQAQAGKGWNLIQRTLWVQAPQDHNSGGDWTLSSEVGASLMNLPFHFQWWCSEEGGGAVQGKNWRGSGWLSVCSRESQQSFVLAVEESLSALVGFHKVQLHDKVKMAQTCSKDLPHGLESLLTYIRINQKLHHGDQWNFTQVKPM